MGAKRGDIVEVDIERMASGGKGVGRAEGLVTFVPFVAPGDRARVKLWKVKKRHAEADLLEIVTPSPHRVEPPCAHYEECGGCSWQHLAYPAQVEAKGDIVRESLERIGGFTDLPLHPPVGAPSPVHYRNKMEFAFHPDTIIGLHRRRKFDEVVPIEACQIAFPEANTVLNLTRSWVLAEGLSCWDKRTHEGRLRHLLVRKGEATNEVLVGLVTTPGALPEAEALTRKLVEAVPNLVGVVHATSASISDSVTVDTQTVLHGRDHLVEALGGLSYDVGLETFFQTNTAQAERLVGRAIELCELTGKERVLDLYCGVGAFSLLLAREAAHVWGIEVVEPSIVAARKNASRAGIENIDFFAGDARKTLPEVTEAAAPLDLLLLDPPRSGAGGKVMRKIGRTRAATIVYVSCNPTTLAHDLTWLPRYGYDIDHVEAFDLFPQTWHVETIVRLRKVRDWDPDVK